MLYAVLAIVVGLVLLVKSADVFVESAATGARHFGVSALVIGMVIVGFGTSAPEIFISIISALENNPGIAVGNAYGSNIANIGLILGITAAIRAIPFDKSLLKRELPFLLMITGVAVVQIWDGMIDLVDGIILFSLLGVFLFNASRSGKIDESDEPNEKPTQSLPRAIALFVVSFLVLLGSSRLMVWGAIEVAQTLGIDEIIIGLTIVAVGTSLPELASSIIAVRKNQHDIALGNVIGSNIFNTLAVVGASALIRPISTAPEILSRDMIVMSALTVSLLIIGLSGRQKPQISRIVGILFLITYTAYTLLLISQATV
ncbi:MAG: calcium/sodium antiporter [Roseiflexaceae bacterium]